MIQYFTKLPKISKKKNKDDRLDFAGDGIECTFYIHNRTGYKMYLSFIEAYKAFHKQKKAYKARLAPRPGKLFVQSVDYDTHYGYTTQIVKMVDEINYKELKKIANKLRKIGIRTNDLHEGNFGYIGKRLVCVDFGEASCR